MTPAITIEPPRPQRCPLCGATVAPDPLGLYACSCGWGGPDDPLEHDRGLTKLATRGDAIETELTTLLFTPKNKKK